MNIPDALFLPILTFLGFLIGYLISYLITKYKINPKIKIVLEIVENFVRANPEWCKLTWKRFYNKIINWIEDNIHIDLTDEQWEEIERELLNIYERIKEELDQEQGGE